MIPYSDIKKWRYLMETKKVIITGASNSGKTTALEHICNSKIKTESMDYGKTIIGNEKIHFFIPSGKERFNFMYDVLSQNIDGAIIFVDNTKGITGIDRKIIDFIKEKRVPYVIFTNKQDLCSKTLNIKFNVPTIPTIATKGHGIEEGLKKLLKLMNNKNNIEIKAYCAY
jgi:signal recognition particle receptor subunit beta